MIAVQVVTMKMSGQQMSGSMKAMPWIMSIMFGYIAFTIPTGFSLYYTVSNIAGFVQSLIAKRIYDPEKIKAQVEAEIEAKRAEKKKKKQVKIKSESGETVMKEVSEAELARIRLARAVPLTKSAIRTMSPRRKKKKKNRSPPQRKKRKRPPRSRSRRPMPPRKSQRHRKAVPRQRQGKSSPLKQCPGKKKRNKQREGGK